MTMVMERELFDQVLQHPAKQFALGERLAKLHPELQIVETDALYFYLESFARAGKCSFEPRDDFYQHFLARWDSDDGITIAPKTAWLNVTWEGDALQVVKVSYATAYCSENHTYAVMGTDRARCLAFIDAVCRWNHEVRGEVLVFTDGYFQKDAALYAAIMKADFEQLVLCGELKQQLRDDFTQFLASRQSYEEHGVPWKRGALLIGPPGNGKTLCVKALVKHLGIPCIYVQSFEAPHSTPRRSIDEVFTRARETTPCMIVLEDIDSLLTDASRSYFLNALDGFATNTGVITLATTNHPDRLDPAIIHRPSRFDRKYHFNLPDAATRAAYIGMWNARLQPALQLTDEGRTQLAEITDGFSFAYIQEVFVSAMMRWISTRETAGILPVALAQIEALREQMLTTR
jgi:hypothetical protein